MNVNSETKINLCLNKSDDFNIQLILLDFNCFRFAVDRVRRLGEMPRTAH